MNTASPIQQFDDDLRRTVERLSSMALDRLERPDRTGRTPADRAHELAGRLVEATEALQSAQHEVPMVPRLRAHGAGSQLAVLGRDLAAAASTCGAAGEATLLTAAEWLRDLRVDHL
ncbi:MAG: hypothetical protein WCI74_20915 [Actinomycetes bacterium]